MEQYKYNKIIRSSVKSVLVLAMLFPICSYAQKLLDIYDNMANSKIKVEIKIFDSSGTLVSTIKAIRTNDTSKHFTTEYQNINQQIYAVKKKYYRLDGLPDSIVIESSRDRRVEKYFYTNNRIASILRSENGALVSKTIFIYNADLDKIERYFYDSGRLVLSEVETHIFHNDHLQETTIYSPLLESLTRKEIVQTKVVNDTIISSLFSSDLSSSSYTIDTVRYSGKILKIVYNGDASNRDEYTYLSGDTTLMTKFRKDDIEYYEKSAILFGQRIPFAYEDSRLRIKGKITYDLLKSTVVEKITDERNRVIKEIYLKLD